MMDDLFERWRSARPEYDNFNEDGIVNKECWDSVDANKRIVFVLKETNNLQGSLAEFLRNGGNDFYYRTWNNIARWAEMIISGVYLDKINRQQLHATLQKIAAINVKKQSGSARSKRKEIIEAAERDRDFLKEEISIIDANIIVTCGFGLVSYCIHNQIYNEPEDNWIHDEETDLWYYVSDISRKEKRTIVISMPHPNRAGKEYTTKLGKLLEKIELT